jgi:hypothetical protein
LFDYAGFVRSFGKDSRRYFCPPPPKRSASKEETESMDKVRSALGNSYKPEVHYAVGHMRRIDGAYPNLSDGIKAVDFFAKTGPRCVKLFRII